MQKNLKFWTPVFETNDLSGLVPEVWAQEALIMLENQTMGASAVHRDFEDAVAEYGDTVNANRPTAFEMQRKGLSDDVIDQNAVTTKIPVIMNQHLYTSFIIRDGQESLSFVKLRDLFLGPALNSIAQGIDRMIFGQVYQFMANPVSKLDVTAGLTQAIALDQKMNELKIPQGFRNCFISPKTKGDLLAVSQFTDADKRGDGGEALKNAEVGEVLGTNWYMSGNVPSIATGNTIIQTVLVDSGTGYPAGTTSLSVKGTHAGLTVGLWCTIAGDMTPQKIITVSASAVNPTGIVIAPGLKYAVADDAVVTCYTPGLVDFGADYAAGWAKSLVTDVFGVAPKPNQLMSFDDPHATSLASPTTKVYSLLGTPTTIASGLLDVPLSADVDNNDIVGIGPAGNYNFAFHPHAIALVTRPLAAPAEGTGALSAVASYNDLSIRVVITYDGVAQGHRVTVDMLAGIKVLNVNLGCVFYA